MQTAFVDIGQKNNTFIHAKEGSESTFIIYYTSENLTADKNKSFGDYLADNNTLELSRIARENRSTVNNTDYEAISNKLYAWWFKRNDAHEKSGCQEDFDITAYDAYYIVPVSDKRIYITFDCGYENGFTPDMLDVLKEEGVTAAFFVTQTFIRDNVELTKRMKEEGHLVCNHTVTHPSMPSKSIDEQKNELLTCENYMKDATGYDMDLFFSLWRILIMMLTISPVPPMLWNILESIITRGQYLLYIMFPRQTMML